MTKLSLFALIFSVFTNLAASAQTAAVPETLRFQNGRLKAGFTWLDAAPLVGPENKLQVQWRNENDEPVDLDGDFRVVLFMPEMGHGSSPTKIGKVADTVGLYRASKLYFTMSGLWEVRVTLRLRDVPAETMSFSLYPREQTE